MLFCIFGTPSISLDSSRRMQSGVFLKSLHARIVKNKGLRAGDRLQELTLSDRYRRYYEARKRIRVGSDDPEPPLEVPAPDSDETDFPREFAAVPAVIQNCRRITDVGRHRRDPC
jgi:hypothetical protein